MGVTTDQIWGLRGWLWTEQNSKRGLMEALQGVACQNLRQHLFIGQNLPQLQ